MAAAAVSSGGAAAAPGGEPAAATGNAGASPAAASSTTAAAASRAPVNPLEPVDLSEFLRDPTSAAAAATVEQVVAQLVQTSCLVVRDPRVTFADNAAFLDMMESYYSQPRDVKLRDMRAETFFQVGVTPSGVERPRDHRARIAALADEHAAHVPTGADLKWRWFHRVGPRPESTRYAELNAEQVVPEGFPDWAEKCDAWGERMLTALLTVCDMLTTGLELPTDETTLRALLDRGPHLLAPTGSDLNEHGDLDTIYAGFHYDLNFLTIHGKSRFPGLYIWLRDGTRHQVKVPDGCLLLQAGKQLEWVTGGFITAGFHEVVCTPETRAAMERLRKENHCMWRVSSTLFGTANSDRTLVPLGKYATPEALRQYPATDAGQQVQEELSHINLKYEPGDAGATTAEPKKNPDDDAEDDKE